MNPIDSLNICFFWGEKGIRGNYFVGVEGSYYSVTNIVKIVM